eukprot:gene10641-14292_t
MRRRIPPESDFFLAGNIERNQMYKISIITTDSINAQNINYDIKSASMILCKEPNCQQSFNTIKEFDSHMFINHSHQCSVCMRSLPSDRLLSIHISESHDNYFKVLSLKKPSFVCLVEGCHVISTSNEVRRVHLINDHRFPKSYDFHNPRKYRKINERLIIKKNEKKNSNKNIINNNENATINEQNMEVDMNEIIGHVNDGKNKQNNSNTKKTKNRKNKDKLLHNNSESVTTRNDNINGMEDSVEMLDNNNIEDDMIVDITHSMNTMNVGVPSKISFGRKGRRN